jgi:hypothetical protein
MSGAPEHIEIDAVELFTRHGASRRHARAHRESSDRVIGFGACRIVAASFSHSALR